MGRLSHRYDRQTTLNQAISKIDALLSKEDKRLEFYRGTSYGIAYRQSWELVAFYSGRRRYLIRRLIRVQIEEFKHG